MFRRVPPAFLIVSLLGSPALAEESFRVPQASVQVSGGAVVQAGAWRQGTGTRWDGWSATGRLRASGYLFPWLGAELDLLEGSFLVRPQAEPMAQGLMMTRLGARAAVTLRLPTSSGFVVDGSIGYALNAYPRVVLDDEGTASTDGALAHGLAFRLGAHFSRGLFDGSLNLYGTFPLGGGLPVRSVGADLYLGVRVLDTERFTMSLGVELSHFIENEKEQQGVAQYLSWRSPLGLAVRVSLVPPRPPRPEVGEGEVIGPTALTTHVTLPDGSPARQAVVRVDGTFFGNADVAGLVQGPMASGAHVLEATLDGFHAVQVPFAIPAGGASFDVSAQLGVLTGPGRLSGVVKAAATQKPLAGAQVSVESASAPVVTGSDGAWAFDKVGPGPVRVLVQAQGFATAEEVAQVPAERSAELDVLLEALGKGSPATVRGLVRSRSGEALRASVVIKGASQKVPVSDEGRFVTSLKGGTYLFVISAPGYVSQSKKVVLADGDQVIFHVELLKGGQ